MSVTITSPGQINGSGSEGALWLKQFSGEVIAEFETAQVTKGRHIVRSISNGETAQFPVFGRTSAAYHTAGTQLGGGSKPYSNEKTISVDGLYVAHNWIAKIEELKTHYDFRAPYAKEQGQALAQRWDKNVLQTMVLAARASANVTGGFSGGSVTAATIGTDSAVLRAGLLTAAQKLDEKWVPGSGRQVYLKPAQYYLLLSDSIVASSLYGGAGNQVSGNIAQWAGMDIVKTNNLPTAALDTDGHITSAGDDPTAILAKYRGDFSTTLGVVNHTDSVGTLQLADVTSESVWHDDFLATLLQTRLACGHGILRPEAAIELKSA